MIRRRGLRIHGGSNPAPFGNQIIARPIKNLSQMTGSVISVSNLSQADSVRDIMGDVILSSSDRIDQSISTGQAHIRSRYDSELLGEQFSNVRIPPRTARSVIDPNLTGSFESPSWTRKNIGLDQAYIIGTTAQSEFFSVNAKPSGNVPLEDSPVPASASSYYGKLDGLRTVTIKKTASFFDTIVPYSGAMVPAQYFPGTGSLITIVTGSNFPPVSSSFRYPASIKLDVPVSGRLVDIKVWIEIVQSSGSAYPLGNLGVALRSPNLKWGHAHPVRNDPVLVSSYISSGNIAFSVDEDQNTFPDRWYPPANFYRDTFLLWEGQGVNSVGSPQGPYPYGPTTFGHLTPRSYITLLPGWQRDRCMRTVFSDGASNPNPRHNFIVPERRSFSGSTVLPNLVTTPSGNAWFGSPNANGTLMNNPNKVPTSVIESGSWSSIEIGVSSFGNNWPWTSDNTVPPFTGTYQGPGSPPNGWLTGPGKTAAINEWPTTGVNYGPAEIRPLYPLLEDIFIEKSIGVEAPMLGTLSTSGSEIFPVIDPGRWRGFRPGLRNSEISGSWEILICGNGLFYENEGRVIPTYFRQVRLELTYENNWHLVTGRNSTGYQPRKSGKYLYQQISGSDGINFFYNSGSWDAYVSNVMSTTPNSSEIGRTFGLQLNSGTFDPHGYAVLFSISGELAEISGSVPDWLLDNEFGIPSIPIDRATPLSSSRIEASDANSFLFPTKKLDSSRRLEDVSSDINPELTIPELANLFVSGSM